MTLAGKYQKFLNSASADALSEKASLNYITTLTTINEPLPILKHLVGQSKLLEKKSEKIISAIDSGSALCVDVETTIEFKMGGGAYLPGLDDNFLSDRVATFPIVHIVHFDERQKITQIRQYWDQGALLKSIEIIGARGKNWPIKESKDQIKLISSSASLTPQATIDISRPSTSSSELSNSQRPTSSRSATRGDPHASLNLFAPREVIEEEDLPAGPGYATRQSAKPEDRDLGELFVGDSTEKNTHGNASRKNSNPGKSGAGKKFTSNRLFDNEDKPADPPQKTSIKTEATRYDHFEFGDGEEADATPARRSIISQVHNKKHQSQWGFEDFVTPQKAGNKVQPQQERHFGWSDDEEESPVKRPVVHQPRANLKAQFEFQDDSTPEGNRKLASNKGAAANKGMGLYKDHVLGEESDATPNAKQPLGNVTAQFNNENRKKDFGSQWEMKDASPAAIQQANANQKNLPVGQTRQDVVKGMDAGWSLYDESPKSKENQPRKIYNTAGNGMGGRKDAHQWNIGDDGGEAEPIHGKKHNQTQANKQTEKNFWDF